MLGEGFSSIVMPNEGILDVRPFGIPIIFLSNISP
jgi:hypothetical protein